MSEQLSKQRTLLERVLLLFTLTALAIAQPLFDLLAKAPEFFVIRKSHTPDLLVLTFTLSFLIPSVISSVAVLLGRLSPRIGKGLLELSTLLLLGLLCLGLLKRVESFQGVLVLFAAAASALVLLIVLKSEAGRLFAKLLSIAVIAVPLLFVTSSEIRRAFFPKLALVTAGSTTSNTSVVMVILDELPLSSLLDGNRQIDSTRYPAFAQLAETSHWFRNASAVSAWTQHAVPAILSGELPQVAPIKMPYVADYPQNLFTVLASSRRLNAYEQATQLCPQALCQQTLSAPPAVERVKALLSDVAAVYLHVIIPNPYAARLPTISSSWENFFGHDHIDETRDRPKGRGRLGKKGLLRKGGSARDVELFERFIDSIKRSTEPTLDFLHVTFPHVPYRYLPSGKLYIQEMENRNDKGYKSKWDLDEWPTVVQYQRHLLQLGYADRLLGRLIAKLKQEGRFDESLIVITADHGTSFQPGEFSRRTSDKNASDILLVPLFIKLPAQSTGKPHDENVQTVDILPTIAAQLGATLDQPVDGRDIFGSRPPAAQKPFMDLVGTTQEPRSFPAQLDLAGTLERKLQLFGANSSDSRIFEIGPRRELLGLTEQELIKRGARQIQVNLAAAKTFENVRPSGPFIPALIAGTIAEPAPLRNPELGICVNGQMVASTYAVNEQTDPTFRAMVPETTFKEGRNEVKVFTLGGAPATTSK